MRILNLHIEEFAGLRDRRIEFGNGLNIIEGDNESGKSTIWLFIKFMLYGMPRKGHEDRIRSVSRDTHTARGSMTVSFQNEEYRIVRSFSDTGRDQCSVYRMGGGEEVLAGRQPGEVFLGVPREIFESSCGVGQAQCQRMGDKKSLEAIRNLLSSADESVDVTKVLQRLDKVRVQYRHKTGKGGKLYELHEQIELARTAKDRAVLNARRKLTLEDRLARMEEQWADNERDAETIRVQLLRMNQLSVVRRFDKIRENETTLQELTSQSEALRTEYLKTDVYPTQMDVANLRVQAQHLSEAQAQLASAEKAKQSLLDEGAICEEDAVVGERLEALGGAATLTRRIDDLERNKKQGLWLFAGGLVAALICVAVGIFTVMAVALSALLPLVAAIWGWGSFARSGKALRALVAEYGKEPNALRSYFTECAEAYRRQRERMERMIRVESERNAAAERARTCERNLREVLSRTNPVGEGQPISPARAIAEAERIERFLQLMTDVERRSHALRMHLAEEREALSRYDEETLRAEIPEEMFGSGDEDFHRLEQRQAFCADRRRALETTRSQIQIELANINAESVSPMEIADRERMLTAKAEQAERYYDALVMAMDALTAASEQMSGTVTPRLGKDAGKMMSYISDGKYTELQTGNSLSPSLWNETGNPIAPEMMSGGTKDAAYLSLRIALMMQIFERELPPLILDESLCALDDRRMARMLAFLGKLSETRLQCLLFTCHKREAVTCAENQIPFRAIHLNADPSASADGMQK